MNKVKMIALGLMSVMTLATAGLIADSALAKTTCPKGSLRGEVEVSNLAECNVEETKDENSLMKRVQTIINVVISVLGIVTVVMIIIGGVQYITSSGDTAKLTKAKNTIMYGVIGLVIALLAFAIVNFVLSNVWGGGDEKKDDDVKASGITVIVS